MSQSYDRWWEARKVWGSIVNDSRTLVLQLQGFVVNDEQTIKRLAYRQMAFSYALGQSLREADVMQYSGSFLSEQDRAKLATHKNIPLAIMQMNAYDIKKLKEDGQIDVFSHVQLDNTLVRLVDSQGKAERIKSTVFPSTYRIFLHFIIYIFVITLSIALDNIDSLFELPLLLVIASCFFLIEKSAFHLQDPFSNKPSDTSVTAIARTIEINTKQLLGEANVPEPLQPNDFFLM
jgi:putative membrane protein